MRYLCVLALAAATGCSSGTIKGSITVGPNTADKAVYASVWSIDYVLSDPSNSESTPVPNNDGNPPTAIGTIAVGTTSGKNATYTYSFDGLAEGLYFVGAFIDTPTDADPNIVALVHTIDTASLLPINPKAKALQVQDHDLFLGISAPGTGTIKGTLHQSNAAAALTTTVWAMTAGLFDPTASEIDQLQVGSGTTVPFELFNMPLANTFLFANSDPNGGLAPNDLMGFPWPNPIPLSATNVEQDGVDIWLDTQSPALGSISGQVVSNAAVTGAEVQVYAQVGGADQQAPVVAMVSLPLTGQSAPFVLPSIGTGGIFLSANIALTLDGQNLVGGSYYPPPPSEPQPVTLTASAPTLTDVQMPIGVGQVLGSVTLLNVPSGDSGVFILASVNMNVVNPNDPSQAEPYFVATQGYGISGSSPATFIYDLFGLTDATYSLQLVLVPAPTNDDLDALFNSGAVTLCAGNPTEVAIQGGDRQTSNFSINFPCTSN